MAEEQFYSPRAISSERTLITPTSGQVQQNQQQFFSRSSSRSIAPLNANINEDIEGVLNIPQDDIDKPTQEIKKSAVSIAYQGMNVFSTMKIRQKILGRIKLRWHKKLQRKHFDFLNDQSSFFNQTNVEIEHGEYDHEKDEDVNWMERFFSEKTVIYLQNLNEKIPVFDPTNPIKLVWDFLYFFVLVILLWLVPIKIAINDSWSESLPAIVPTVCMVFMILQSLINMNTGFFETGEIIKERKKIINRYIHKHFIIDTISVLIILINIYNDQDVSNYFLLFVYVKMKDLERIIMKLQESINMDELQKLYLSLLKVLGNVLFVAHIFACLWLFVYTFVTQQQENWMQQKGVDTSTWYNQYLFSLYFSVVTMVTVGFGDITPTLSNKLEVIICILSILIQCGVFAYSINEIGIIFQEYNLKKQEIQNNFEIINNYMEQKKIDHNLRYQIREYLNYFWKESQTNMQDQEEEIIGQLSDNLKRKLILDSNQDILSIPIFKDNFSQQFMNQMGTVIQETFFQPYDIVYKQGEGSECRIYFPDKGVFQKIITERPEERSKEKVLKKYEKGSYFGIESFFLGDQRHETIRALNFGKLKFIDRQQILQILEQLPEDYQKFCFLKEKLKGGERERTLKQKCQSCDSDEHNIGECHLLHFYPSKNTLIQRENNMHQSEREKFVRGGNFRQRKNKSLKLFHLVNDEIMNFIDENEQLIDDLYPDNENNEEEFEDDNNNEEFMEPEELPKSNTRINRMNSVINEDIQEEGDDYNDSFDNQGSFIKPSPVMSEAKISSRINSVNNLEDLQQKNENQGHIWVSNLEQTTKDTGVNENHISNYNTSNNDSSMLTNQISKLSRKSILQQSNSSQFDVGTKNSPQVFGRKIKQIRMSTKSNEEEDQQQQQQHLQQQQSQQQQQQLDLQNKNQRKSKPNLNIERNSVSRINIPISNNRTSIKRKSIAIINPPGSANSIPGTVFSNNNLNQYNNQNAVNNLTHHGSVTSVWNFQDQSMGSAMHYDVHNTMPLQETDTFGVEIHRFSIIEDFDKNKEFVYFFPTFNISKVLRQYEEFMEAKEMLFQQQVSNLNSILKNSRNILRQQFATQLDPALKRSKSQKTLFPLQSQIPSTNLILQRQDQIGQLVQIDLLNQNTQNLT